MMTDDELLDLLGGTANSIITRVRDTGSKDKKYEAAYLILERMMSGGNALRFLHESRQDFAAIDGAVIVRGIYDAMLQALCILADRSPDHKLGRDYLDFFWVEKWNAIKLYDNSPTGLGKRISNSPRRQETEHLIRGEYDRVRMRFQTKQGKDWPHWYKGSLRDLATSLNLEHEYELLQKNLSGAVHSSSYALKEGMNVNLTSMHALLFSWHFTYRVLGDLANHCDIALSADELALIRSYESNVFDMPSPHA